MSKRIFWDLHCFQCSLQFEKKSIYDMHLSLIHSYKSKTNIFDDKIKSEPKEIESSNHASHIQSKHILETEKIKKVDSTNKKNRLFKCGYCGKYFSKKQSMNCHVTSVHEGKKPFKCEYCDHVFGQNCYMQQHVASVH